MFLVNSFRLYEKSLDIQRRYMKRMLLSSISWSVCPLGTNMMAEEKVRVILLMFAGAMGENSNSTIRNAIVKKQN